MAPGAPRTIATSLTMMSLPRRSDPKPYAPTAKATISTGIVTHAHSRLSSRSQDEVVDRPDEQDVAAEQRDEPADRRQRERRQLRGGLDDLAVVADAGPPRGAGRDQAAPEALGDASVRPASSAVGSKPTIVTAPAPYVRSAATPGRRPWPAPGPRSARRTGPAGRSASAGSSPSSAPRDAGATSVVVVGR